MAMLELRHGDLTATVDPALGGAVLSLRRGEEDLLRPTPAGAADVLQTACFPLVPFANRIAQGRFAWGGRSAVLPPNLAGQAHPLHGDGWLGGWTVEAADAAAATLEFTPQGSAWPWRYRAAQSVRLDDCGLNLALSVMKRVGEDLQADPVFGALILQPLELLGVDKLGESTVILKARFKTLPGQQATVGREYNKRIKEAFDAEGIELPSPTRVMIAEFRNMETPAEPRPDAEPQRPNG